MASVEYAVPQKRNPVRAWMRSHAKAVVVVGCAAFWLAAGTVLYFIV